MNADLSTAWPRRCHGLMGIPICGACHRPVEERVITALGKKTGMQSISCVPYLKSPSLATSTMVNSFLSNDLT
uniref:Uncharacterized protein n=1 Tax=Ditylenchus dipsaci TaxID=166011 RepID=A0A915E6U4_9BILA